MANILLSANSIGWGAGLNLSAELSWDSQDLSSNIQVHLKLVMTLKKDYGFNATPPVYVRVYQDGSPTEYDSKKNTTHVSFNGAATRAFTLYDAVAFTLPRGHDYTFTLSYGPAYINNKNVGIETQTDAVYIPIAADPDLRAWVTVDESADLKRPLTLHVSSRVSAAMTVVWNVVEANGGRVVLNQTDAVPACFDYTDTQTIDTLFGEQYKIECTVTQNGVTKLANATTAVSPWVSPKIASVTVTCHDPLSANVTIVASADLRNTHFLTEGRIITEAGMLLMSASTTTFAGNNTAATAQLSFDGELEATSTYRLIVTVTDAQFRNAQETVLFTTPAFPGLRGTVVHNNQLHNGVVYYCVDSTSAPRKVIDAAICQNGQIKKIKQTQ